MNWQTVWNKARYAIVPLVCLAGIAIAVFYGTGRGTKVEQKRAGTTEKASRPRQDRIDPDAAKRYGDAFAAHLSRMDRLAAQRTARDLVRTMAQLETERISLDDARSSTRNSALGMLTQGNFRVEMSEVSKEIENPSPKNTKDWLDGILDANPRKFLFVIVIVLVVVLLVGAILGKAEIRRMAWTMAIILIAFLVVNQFWKSGGSTSAQGNPASVSTQQQTRQKVIRVQIPENNQLSEWVMLPPGSVGNWRAPGNIEFLLPNGKTIKVADGNTNYRLGGVHKFRLRGDPGEAVFTLN
ncbi:MAG: hypothetical protein WAP55_00280 [Minisyncoccia bacterium]